MQPIINNLVQLQDFIIARAQQVAAGATEEQLRELVDSIQALKANLPKDVEEQFSRLAKRDSLAVVPVINGVCTACGMTLPIALTHQVHAAEKLHACPSCARLLYYAEGGPRNTRKAARRTDPPRVGIERFSSEALMIPELQGTTRDEVICELAQKMADVGFVDNAQDLAESGIRREAIISTALDFGLAFPHVRCVEGGALTMALGLAPAGIVFNPTTSTKTNIIFFMVIPTAASAFYLKLLSGLAQVFSKEDNRAKLLAAGTGEKMWKVLVKATAKVLA